LAIWLRPPKREQNFARLKFFGSRFRMLNVVR